MKTTNLILLACASACATALAENTCCGAWPEGKDPAVISARITDQFLSGRPEDYHPQGYHGNKGYGWKRSVQYSVVSLWLNAIECARLRGDKEREEKLVRLFDDFLPGGKLSFCCSRPYHVDDTIFGALPYEIYLGTKEPKYLALGNYYADTQWTPPCDGTVKERHALPREKQEEFWKGGYTPQTRLWIDDMYMITVLQSQAYRATGNRVYIDRTAREMCLYLDELQLKEGPAKGLFYHAPDVHYVWGRGDGWMAAGMALVLDRLPEDSPYRARIMSGYRLMMETLLRFQRADGLCGPSRGPPQLGRDLLLGDVRVRVRDGREARLAAEGVVRPRVPQGVARALRPPRRVREHLRRVRGHRQEERPAVLLRPSARERRSPWPGAHALDIVSAAGEVRR